MRRLFYCGEWLESHALHLHLLAAPDFLGYPSGIALAADYPDEVRRGLRLQGVGNAILRFLGARSVHPVGARLGGFFRAPEPGQAAALLDDLKAALPEAEALVEWVAGLDLPDYQHAGTQVALRHPDEYPFNEGRLVSSSGLDIAISEYPEHFEEQHIPHSTALHAHLHGEPYLVGPLARVNLNQDLLPGPVRKRLEAVGNPFPSANLFHSALARAVEIHFALVEAIALLEDYTVPEAPAVETTPQEGVGFGCTEAPRGILWHRYETDANGHIHKATIVPPTSQNQAHIEADLRQTLEAAGLDRPDEELRALGETVIRNYDPCISCATHFLDVNVRRR